MTRMLNCMGWLNPRGLSLLLHVFLWNWHSVGFGKLLAGHRPLHQIMGSWLLVMQKGNHNKHLLEMCLWEWYTLLCTKHQRLRVELLKFIGSVSHGGGVVVSVPSLLGVFLFFYNYTDISLIRIEEPARQSWNQLFHSLVRRCTFLF